MAKDTWRLVTRGTDGELVGACVFLASPRASSFVTGSDLRVDGGFLSQTI